MALATATSSTVEDIHAFGERDGVEVKAERKSRRDDPREVHRKWVCWPMTFAEAEVPRRGALRGRDDDFYLEQRPSEDSSRSTLKTGGGQHDTIGSARILRAGEGFDLDRVGPVDPVPTTKRKGEWEWLIEDFEPDKDIRGLSRVPGLEARCGAPHRCPRSSRTMRF